MLYILEKIKWIDGVLSEWEDWMHGEDGDKVTTARKFLSEIERDLIVSKMNDLTIGTSPWLEEAKQRHKLD